MKAVFLDRDGVLSEAPMRDGKPGSPRTLAEFRLLPGVPEAVRRLKEAGYLVIVVTNQPDVARGLVSQEVIDQMHHSLICSCRMDGVFACFHDSGCNCRKPACGLLLDAAAIHNIELRGSWMVGDQERDIEAGRRAGCNVVFIDRGYAMPKPKAAYVDDLQAAVEWILKS